MKERTFFYTLNPGDYSPKRIRPGSNVLLVATAHWNNRTKRFSRTIPDLKLINQVAIDSGGYTASRKWGAYPWSAGQYAQWVRDMRQRIGEKFLFAASMDFVCSRTKDHHTTRENLRRIDQTHELELELIQLAPAVPWLPVIQGDNLKEREYCFNRRCYLGLREEDAGYYGVGSIVGRPVGSVRETFAFLNKVFPGDFFHAFGLNAKVIRSREADVFNIESWDTYSWCYGRGRKYGPNKPPIAQREEESYSEYTRRLAIEYWARVVQPRLDYSL